MPAPPPALYPRNVLEDAVLTLTPDGAVAGKGTGRLVDRDLGLECEDAGTAGPRVYTADRGLDAAPELVAAWFLTGAGIAGQAVTLESSPDGDTWTTRGTVTPPADGSHRVPVTPFTAPRFVRWTFTDPPAPIRLTEVSLAPALTFKWKPAAGSLREPLVLNVNTVQSVSGRGWGVQRGPRRWAQSFVMASAPDTDRVRLYQLLDEIADTAKPFWLLTVTNELRWVRLVDPIDLSGVSRSPSGEWDIPLSVLEELP